MQDSKIGWTDHTFNPWIGCTKVSPGCDFCYAKDQRERYGFAEWGPGVPRTLTSDTNWREPLKWNRAAEKAGVMASVFCLSLGDICDAEVPAEWRARLIALIKATPWLRWLLLTKRPNNYRRFYGELFGLSNVWWGASVESQAQMWRAETVTRLAVAGGTFLSCEPLLGPLDLMSARECRACGPVQVPHYCDGLGTPFYRGHGLPHWVIVGAESGPKRRPFENRWALELKAQCAAAGVAFFAKQGPGFKSEQPFGDERLDGVRELPWGAGEVPGSEFREASGVLP